MLLTLFCNINRSDFRLFATYMAFCPLIKRFSHYICYLSARVRVRVDGAPYLISITLVVLQVEWVRGCLCFELHKTWNIPKHYIQFIRRDRWQSYRCFTLVLSPRQFFQSSHFVELSVKSFVTKYPTMNLTVSRLKPSKLHTI